MTMLLKLRNAILGLKAWNLWLGFLGLLLMTGAGAGLMVFWKGLVITNLNDPSVDNIVTDQVVNLWRTRWAVEVQTYQFCRDLGLSHDIIDVNDPHMNVAAVYPKLLELIDR